MELELRRALEAGEFQVYYQPVVQLATGKVVEVEALVRWLDPRRGLVSPVDFIPIAEETGLIVALGQWILGQACRQFKVWQDEYRHHGPDAHCCDVCVGCPSNERKTIRAARPLT